MKICKIIIKYFAVFLVLFLKNLLVFKCNLAISDIFNIYNINKYLYKNIHKKNLLYISKEAFF